MKTITSVAALREELLNEWEHSIGLVPTMGSLHAGHFSLIKEAKKNNDIVVVSIFVNPLQFGPDEDYDTYPRAFMMDEQYAEELGVDIVFAPTVQEMYPRTMYNKVHVEKGTQALCGKSRPGHFDGVSTVVLKLFNIVEPKRAYFGLKDAQQVAVIENMVIDFNLPVEIAACETVREKDGLAVSSRNSNLTRQERGQAVYLHDCLQEVKKSVEAGERDTAILEEEMRAFLHSNTDGVVDYCEILTFPELKHQSLLSGKIIIAAALQFSKVRLIDNVIVHVKGEKSYVSNNDEI
ncbi:pantoate--beta-alanine ligase [Salibacterium salarium]|uniref:Pantothenate synthetase n=1 Tax=Salibacterium salarium TaxID=284579 RepID=A0A3R9QU11_9BACI|nr:pantoate--beta-alanine ligase [Salibacterium salarium]RSL33435.1 pantoate--beta-alanine ligase [Salibacterium salarium]